MVIEEQTKVKIKEIFNEWLDLLDGRKEINNQIADLRSDVADLLSVKPGIVTKLFNYLKKMNEGGDDEISSIKEIAENLGF